jgi:hypothetical protein
MTIYTTIDAIDKLKLRIKVENEALKSEIIFKWQELITVTSPDGSISLTTSLEHNDDSQISLLDAPLKVSVLAKSVFKSRGLKDKSDNILVKKDNNTLVQGASKSNIIGYWDSQLRPLESPFSQMNLYIKSSDAKCLIFSLRLYHCGLIQLNPDITLNESHSFNFKDSSWKLYIENISEPINAIDEDKEEKIYTEFYSKQALFSPIAGLVYEEPHLFSLKLHILGEIISCTDNEPCGPLYLKYQVDLCDLWELSCKSSNDCLNGTSSLSHKKKNTYTFNQPLDLSLICKDVVNPPSWPSIKFVLYSIDSWGRTRIQGYGISSFPQSPGMHSQTVHTWKPEESRVNTLSSYFLGGSTYLDLSNDFNHVSISNTDKINRFGWYTKSTGTISMKYFMIFSTESYSKKTKDDSNDSGVGNLAVLATAISRAKARLMSLKQEIST